jgi:hypothetical protein
VRHFFAEQRRRVNGRRDPIDRVPRGRVAGPSLASEVAPPPVGRDQSGPYALFCAIRKKRRAPCLTLPNAQLHADMLQYSSVRMRFI